MGASGGVDSQCSNWNRIRRTDLIHHSNQPRSFGDFDHGSHPATAGRNQVNLPFSYHYHRSKGTSLPRRRRGTTIHDMRETLFVRSPNRMEEAQVVPLLSIHPHIVATGRNDDTTKPTVYSYRQQWNPCHMDSWSCLPASH